MQGQPVAFGPFILNPDAGTLLREGVPVPISYRGLPLLGALANRPGEVLSKADLMDKGWPGLAVEEGNLTVQIALLRKLLGAAPDGAGWIATIPRVGYRFTTKVKKAEDAPVVGGIADPTLANPPLQDKPSIAVLPFTNLSADPEQEYFADGMVEEITTALSLNHWLFVIARNSSFTYKGRSVDIKQVGRELGVRYVLEGSVRKAINKVRIAGQLVDTSSGAHLWAQTFDGELTNIFDLQDQVTASVVGAIAPKLEQAEIERAKRKPTESLDAYDYFLRGMAAFHQFTKQGNETALTLFYRATELDQEFAASYGMAARCYMQRKGFGWSNPGEPDITETARLARLAADLGRDDAVALCSAGFSLVVVAGDLDDGAALIDRALALNPNLAWVWHYSAFAKIFLGDPELAIEHAGRAMRLSPQDPHMFAMRAGTALGHYFTGRYDEASSWAEAAVREQPNFFVGMCAAAASSALAGKLAQAEKAMAHVRRLNPALSLNNLGGLLPFRRPEDFDRWAEGLCKAGLTGLTPWPP